MLGPKRLGIHKEKIPSDTSKTKSIKATDATKNANTAYHKTSINHVSTSTTNLAHATKKHEQ